jgi:hypothetical protein
MNKDDNIVNYPHSIETRVALVEMSIVNVNQTLIRIEKRFDKIDDKFDRISKDMKFDFRFLLGAICILGGIMAHGFHWF